MRWWVGVVRTGVERLPGKIRDGLVVHLLALLLIDWIKGWMDGMEWKLAIAVIEGPPNADPAIPYYPPQPPPITHLTHLGLELLLQVEDPPEHLLVREPVQGARQGVEAARVGEVGVGEGGGHLFVRGFGRGRG